MPLSADFFNNEAFDMINVTKALMKMPYQERMLSNMGLFTEGDAESLETDVAEIDEMDGKIQIFKTSTRGGPDTKMAKEEKRKARLFKVPHIPVSDRIYPNEIQNDRVTGELSLESAVNKVNNRLQWGRQQMENTWEIHKLGALKGTLLDSDGSVIFDYATEFGVTQPTDTLNLTGASTDVRGAAMGYAETIEDALGATPHTGLMAICGRTFFKDLVANETVKDTYKNWEAAEWLRTNPSEQPFNFGGIAWTKYRGMRGLANDIGIVADDMAYIFPVGSDVFRTYFAPANFMSSVNQVGVPLVAKVAPDMHADRFVDVIMDSNPLFMNTRPNTVIEVTGT